MSVAVRYAGQAKYARVGSGVVYRNVNESAVMFATMTDEEIASSETPAFDAAMRERALAWIEMTPEERFKAFHGWPPEHRVVPDCGCWFCGVPFHLRGWDNPVWRAAKAEAERARTRT